MVDLDAWTISGYFSGYRSSNEKCPQDFINAFVGYLKDLDAEDQLNELNPTSLSLRVRLVASRYVKEIETPERDKASRMNMLRSGFSAVMRDIGLPEQFVREYEKSTARHPSG